MTRPKTTLWMVASVLSTIVSFNLAIVGSAFAEASPDSSLADSTLVVIKSGDTTDLTIALATLCFLILMLFLFKSAVHRPDPNPEHHE